jgi:hypothetical protein
VISSVPVGFVAQPDAVGDTGPSDLAKAARDDGQPDALPESVNLNEALFNRIY